jgi:hypothetical protein
MKNYKKERKKKKWHLPWKSPETRMVHFWNEAMTGQGPLLSAKY